MENRLFKNKFIVALMASALVIGIGSFLYFSNFSGAKNSANVNAKQTRNQMLVSALGRIEPADRVIKLTAPPMQQQGAARLAKLFIKEGEQVAENQVVAEIDGKDKVRAEVLEAEKQVLVAESKLAQVRAGAKTGDIAAQDAAVSRAQIELERARSELRRAENPTASGVVPAPEFVAIKRLEADLENANVELARSEKLFASGDTSKSELDTRRTTVKTLTREIERSQATLQTVVAERRAAVKALAQDIERNRSQLRSVSEVRPTDVQAAVAEVETARAAFAKAKVSLADLDVKALSSGRVLKINTRPGEAISNDGILELGETSQMFVVAEVFEDDVALVKNGQTAEMIVRSNNQTLRGEIAEIGWRIGKRSLLDTDPVADVDSRVVEVRIRLNPDDSRRVANLTNLRVDVKINVG